MNATADNPAGGGKREAILDAAKKVFLEVGFGAASMDAIAAAAQVSKQTVYNHFGSKEELFGAMVRASCDQMIAGFSEAAKGGDPEKTLRAIAELHASILSSDEKQALRRILVAEAPRFPELARVYYQSGPELTRKAVADYLAEQTRRGVLKVDNPRLTAEQFFGMLSSCRMRSEFGIEPPPSEALQKLYIDNAVALVIKASRP
ncbi:MAG TPA: TetR/AcrR family transcriptional regulator [Gammaproteobacteria bacterium]|nr:TetR/AcrR family transcriptional regulator [Gammaproteobacteria bacterium]